MIKFLKKLDFFSNAFHFFINWNFENLLRIYLYIIIQAIKPNEALKEQKNKVLLEKRIWKFA